MLSSLPAAGAANADVVGKAHHWWRQAAQKAGVDLSGFDDKAPLAQRLAWALNLGLLIGSILSRFSSKMQHSTDGQVQSCVEYAATHGIYVPPELICVDEATSGRKVRRDGLERVKQVLTQRLATVLLVFNFSRLMRSSYKGRAFIQEEVVDAGFRAISVSQNIDTALTGWKSSTSLYGIMDELLIDTIADHVLAGQKTLFASGCVTGALTLGYRRVEVPGPLTNRGLPRTMPQVDDAIAELIRQHFSLIADGMPISAGLRRWIEAGGPCDPRAITGRMTHHAYRRMLSNSRYIGQWAFGRKRNVWSSKKDHTKTVARPESEVLICRREDLRIVSDEVFQKVQLRLAELKLGPRGPKKRSADLNLWDLVTDCFHCGKCGDRFHATGADGRAMGCQHGNLCPDNIDLNRRAAVRAACEKLAELLQNDSEMLEMTICRAVELDAQGDETLDAQIDAERRQIKLLNSKFDDLTEMAGQGDEQARTALKAKTRAVGFDRAKHDAELARLLAEKARTRRTIRNEEVHEVLAGLDRLLCDAAAGKLGTDCIYRAADTFRQLVGGRILVNADPRAARKRKNVRGTFTPNLLDFVGPKVGFIGDRPATEPASVEVWLREPPTRDRLAEAVHEMIDVQGLSFRQAADVLKQQGHTGNAEIVRQIYHRYYEMIGQKAPPRGYNGGQPRKPR